MEKLEKARAIELLQVEAVAIRAREDLTTAQKMNRLIVISEALSRWGANRRLAAWK